MKLVLTLEHRRSLYPSEKTRETHTLSSILANSSAHFPSKKGAMTLVSISEDPSFGTENPADPAGLIVKFGFPKKVRLEVME